MCIRLRCIFYNLLLAPSAVLVLSELSVQLPCMCTAAMAAEYIGQWSCIIDSYRAQNPHLPDNREREKMQDKIVFLRRMGIHVKPNR